MRPAQFHLRAAAIAVIVTALRLIAARWIHLTEDEAYYRLWAQHLQFGYYDHPPMIAWWIRAGVQLAGDNPLGVRLLAVLATGLATWLVADLAAILGAPASAALRAAVWYNATLTIGLGGILATPDAPATLFWVTTLWCLAKVGKGGSLRWWLGAGLAAGLATISKYSALFLGPGVLLWLWLEPGGRKMLMTPWPWLAAGIAASIFATNGVWNAQHHWVTFIKQFGRAEVGGFSPAHLGDLLISQFFLLNPIIAIYAARGAGQGWRERNDPGAVRLLLPLATTAPFVGYLVLHSLHDRVQGHWPVPVFAALVICAAVAVEAGSKTATARVLRGLVIGLGYGLSAAALIYMAAPRSHALGTFDPILPLRGWRTFSLEVDRRREAAGAAWIGTVSYGALAQLSAENLIHAPMIQIDERVRYAGGPATDADLSRPGLIVDLARRLEPRKLQLCFAQVTPAGDIDRGAEGAGPAARYSAYVVSGPRVDVLNDGCPETLPKRRGR